MTISNGASKTMKKISKIIKISFFLSFFLVEFFGFGMLKHVKADGCVYGVSFDVNPKSVAYNSKVTLTTKVNISGTSNNGLECGKPSYFPKAVIKYFVTSDNAPSTQPFFGLNNISDNIILNFSNGQAQNTQDYYLNNFFNADGNDKSGRPVYYPVQGGSFFVRVYEYDTSSTFAVIGSNKTTSTVVPIIITGPAGAPSSLISSVAADKPSVKIGDTIVFTFKNMPTNWGGTVYVNSPSNYKTVAKNEANTFLLQVTKENGFTETGQNVVTFELNDNGNNGNSVHWDSSGGKVTITTGAAAAPGSVGSTTPGGIQSNSVTQLYNPLPEEDIVHAFLLLIQGLLAILGIFSVAFIVFGGFQLVISSGNEEAILKAKKTIIWAVLGLVIAILSFSVVAIVEEILKVNIKPAFYNSKVLRNV